MDVRLVFLLLCVPACLAHIRLTWPQARYPQLDFLDNIRSGLPCGVPFDPKTQIVTTVAAGSTIDVSWHLGFAHRGGVEVNLLTPIATYNLTTGFVRSDDPTLLHLRVTLPAGITCAAANGSTCTLHIRHQALEWGTNYIFHSCADLNVTAATTSMQAACGARNGEVCSGNGKCIDNMCQCNRLASGTTCQNVDECLNDEDCGGYRRGVCQKLGFTSYPKNQCYCRAGWMGPKCTKQSTLTNALIEETGYYQNKMKVNDNYYLYWKVTQGATPEIEIAMKVRSSSWVGLGWRPNTVTASCLDKPRVLARGTSTRRCRPASEPEPEGEGTAAPEGTPEGTAAPEGTP
eukprot:scpid90980/ scgid25339/ 